VVQLKVGELQKQVQMLCMKNSELCAQAKSGKRMGSRSLLSGNEKLISQFAKKFMVMNEMFMPSGLPMQKPLDTPSWYVQEEPQAEVQPNKLSVNFLNFTISNDGLMPSVPVDTFTASHVRESTPALRRPTEAPHVNQPTSKATAAPHIHRQTAAPHIYQLTPATAFTLPLIPTDSIPPLISVATAAPCNHGPTAAPHVYRPTPSTAFTAPLIPVPIAAPRICGPITAPHVNQPTSTATAIIPLLIPVATAAPHTHRPLQHLKSIDRLLL
jgi:hypothetical protein